MSLNGVSSGSAAIQSALPGTGVFLAFSASGIKKKHSTAASSSANTAAKIRPAARSPLRRLFLILMTASSGNIII